MSRADFDFFKHVEVPEKWIKNALNIPQTAKKTPKVSPVRRYVAAASIVFVAALGVGLYFVFRNINPIPVAPIIPSVSTEATVSSTVTPTAESVTPTISTTAPTSVPHTETATTDAVQGAAENEPTAATTAAPTEKSSQSVLTMNPLRPTAPSNPTATQKPEETHVPTDSPATQPPTQRPTSAPTESTTTGYSSDAVTKRIELRLPLLPESTAEDDDSTLYCCIYDRAGRALGDPDLYSRNHWIDVISASDGSSLPVMYYAVDYDINAVTGNRFTYKIYLRNGTVLDAGDVPVS